jgi:Flp pilus assembly protein TadD
VAQRTNRARDRKGAKSRPASSAGQPARRESGGCLFPLLAALAPLLLFWWTTGFGFLLDDYVLYQTSPSLQSLDSIPQGFLTDVGALRKGSETVLGSYYRPVFLGLSTLYYQVAGGQPFAWHLAAVVLAGAIGALAFLLFRRVGTPPLLALLASLVFSLHPAHVSSIAWASGLQELLAAFFVLVALLALLGRRLLLATVAFVLALLSKEVAVGLLPFIAIWAFARREADPEESRRFGKAAAIFGALTLIYLGLRIAVLGGLAKPWLHAPELAESLPSVPLAFVTYLRLLVWPVGFSIFRPERPVWSFFDGPVLLALLVIVVLAVLAAVVIRRRRDLLLPVAWLVVWLLPVLNLWALDPQLMVSDRYLFLPALALPWLVLALVPRRFSVPVLALLAVAFGALSLRYMAIFKDERTFVAAMEKAEPTSPLILTEKARFLRRDGQTTLAEAALRRALELEPRDATNLRSLGDIEVQRGDFAAAEEHYRRALEDDPAGSKPFKLLALALAQAGQTQKSHALLEESARRWPDDFEVQLMYAISLGLRGERASAENAFAAARRLRPDDPALAGGLDSALARLGGRLRPGG